MSEVIRKLVGQKFGKLTVKDSASRNKFGHICYLCECDCGNDIIQPSHYLTSGHSKSCGCVKPKRDLTNKVFGYLTVKEKIGVDSKNNTQWLCVCKCGKEKVIRANNLLRGRTQSCGCLKGETICKINYNRGGEMGDEVNFKAKYSEYIRMAKKRNKSWGLSEKEVSILFKGTCYYCGVEPSQVIQRKGSRIPLVYNGIDRIDNDLGYTKENCVSCCGICNKAKQTLTFKNFKNWVNRIYNHLFGDTNSANS